MISVNPVGYIWFAQPLYWFRNRTEWRSMYRCKEGKRGKLLMNHVSLHENPLQWHWQFRSSCTAVPLWPQMTDVKGQRELEMLHRAEKCRYSHLHVKWPEKKGSSHVFRGAAPTSFLILQSPTTHQRIMPISQRYNWACAERLPIPTLPFASLSPGLWPDLRATEITAQQYFWTLDKLATSVKISL